MTPPSPLESYREALLFLATAGVVVPLFHRLRLSPVLGFLAAGVALGPFGLGRFGDHVEFLNYLSISNVERVASVAEFGLVFLLFMIGLELSWERLERMRRLIFGLGLAQMLVSTGALAAIGYFWFALDPAPSLVMGGALAMSSTGLVMGVLAETRRLNKPAGRAAFAVLLTQDLAVAPALLFISLMQRAHEHPLTPFELFATFAPACVALGGLILAGRLFLRPLFHLVASAQSTELFVAACLLIVVGAGVVSASAGFSMELGAFVAGLLLAETEYRREIEVTMEPFKGLLLGLFFVSIGAELNLDLLLGDPLLFVGYASGLIGLKAALTSLLALALKFPASVAAETGLLLAPGGEFAFALLTFASVAGVLPGQHGAEAMVAVTLSMFAAPLLARLGARFPSGKSAEALRAEFAHLMPEGDVAAGKVLIVGFGRVGALLGEMLSRHEIPFVAIDDAVSVVAERRNEGVDIYWGSAEKRELLAKCGLEQARALAVTVTKVEAAVEIVRVAHEMRGDMTIVARARDADHATRLYEAGATDAIPETIEASLQLAETVLVDIGVPMGHVIASIHGKRDEYREILKPKAEEARERQFKRLALRSRLLARRRVQNQAEDETG
ncbi:cation:proton antiporter [Methylocystis bryophila]|uniref:Potassium transporter TrkA n=1 Tax=Methylocystis bryophila TaxID=655015 RepID=A0A1W6MQ88_9HYPH|nr:cation:proton antiporter [Methylocystis bryophila]ARN79754.1 potassium transporter TrkA [Methylocystis bryophila]BDV39628.1 potassium transporter TrkA [Methylocystis bryophila]